MKADDALTILTSAARPSPVLREAIKAVALYINRLETAGDRVVHSMQPLSLAGEHLAMCEWDDAVDAWWLIRRG